VPETPARESARNCTASPTRSGPNDDSIARHRLAGIGLGPAANQAENDPSYRIAATTDRLGVRTRGDDRAEWRIPDTTSERHRSVARVLGLAVGDTFQHLRRKAGAFCDIIDRVTLPYQVTGLLESPATAGVEPAHNDLTRVTSLVRPAET
jgi:hypothetical protein